MGETRLHQGSRGYHKKGWGRTASLSLSLEVEAIIGSDLFLQEQLKDIIIITNHRQRMSFWNELLE